jgi:hypothetical protein
MSGINRVSTVINELAEVLKPEDFNEFLIAKTPVTSLQRLGFILDKVIGKKELGDSLFLALKQARVKFFRTPLKASTSVNSFNSDERWKVIVNTGIEIKQ